MVFSFPGRDGGIVVIPVKVGVTLAMIVVGVIGVEMAKRGMAEGDQQGYRNRDMKTLPHDPFSLLLLLRIK